MEMWAEAGDMDLALEHEMEQDIASLQKFVARGTTHTVMAHEVTTHIKQMCGLMDSAVTGKPIILISVGVSQSYPGRLAADYNRGKYSLRPKYVRSVRRRPYDAD